MLDTVSELRYLFVKEAVSNSEKKEKEKWLRERV